MPSITADDILTSDGRYKARARQADRAVRDAAHILAGRLYELLVLFNERPLITSGYRTPAANKAAGGAKFSSHLEGRAVDFADPEGKLAQWCLSHLYVLEKFGLWMEDPDYTKGKKPGAGWVHLQSRPAANRVFKP